MSVTKRSLCTFFSVVIVLIGIVTMTKTRPVGAVDITTQASDTEVRPAENAAKSGSNTADECTTLPQYEWDHDENAQPAEVLETVLKEKNLDSKMETLIRESFNQLTRNYPAAYAILRSSGVPDLHTVQMNFVFAVAHTKAFDTFTGSDYHYEGSCVHIGGSCGFFWSRFDLMCVRESCLTPTKDTCDLFLHEMMHAYQDVYLDSEYNKRNCGELWNGMYYILIEGDAQLYNAAYSDRIESLAPATYKLSDAHETSLVQTGRTQDKNYNMVYKLHTMLQHLLGYDTMQTMRYRSDTKQEEAFLSRKYSIDGEKFMHACALLGKSAFTGVEWIEKDGEVLQSDTSVNPELLAYVDKTFVQCLAREIRDIDSADTQAVKDFYNFYRFYKMQYQPAVHANVRGADVVVTDDFFGNDAVENVLFQTCSDAGLSCVALDEHGSRANFDALLSVR